MAALVFYYVMFFVSLGLVIFYTSIFHKHLDANVTIMTILAPIINFAFIAMAQAKTVNEAIIALRFTYIGGCFLLMSAMFLIFTICDIKLNRWVRVGIVLVSCAIFSSTLTIGYNDLFYAGLPDIAYFEGAAYLTNKHYGVMHTVFYVLIGLYYLATVGAIIYSFIKKRQVPINVLILIIVAISVSVIGFFGVRFITNKIELLPATYNMGMLIYLIVATRLRLYDPSDSVIDSLVQRGDRGFISLDGKLRYLGSNQTAKNMIPELASLRIDHKIIENEYFKDFFPKWMEEFEKDNNNNKQYIERDNKTYLFDINRIMIDRFHRGYQVLISDDTANQQYIKLIRSYNSELEKEVAKKTKNIIEMQEKLVMGMATMVEGRDNSTGGHIKRTSDCIRILIDEIKKDNTLKLSDEFCNALIKAAPMHDLGKITIDDQILRKPGKFTPEEFEIMKTHAAEGARIVSKILEGTDDKFFMNIAVNVAHYHHERWDGSGYPNKLKGEDIPLEARIMAIADVYDALVSKRVYKERMSFETANNIILEGMGKHFDKRLEKYYLSAKPKLEEYYSKLD